MSITDYLDPISYPDAWNTVEVGGQEWDGFVEVSGFKRDFGWDVKKGKGTKGATLTLNEFPPAEGKFTFHLWGEGQFYLWAQFQRLFDYDPPKTKTTAVDVYHPALAALGIKSIVAKSIGMLTHKGKGLYTVEVEVIEYLPPPPTPKVVTPDGSKSSAGKKPGSSDDPVADAQQDQIAKLLAEAKKP
jgi:hypothetical protein